MSNENVIGIQIGASKEAIKAARRAVLDILDAPRDEATIRAALKAFIHVAEVKGANVSGTSIGPLVSNYDWQPSFPMEPDPE